MGGRLMYCDRHKNRASYKKHNKVNVLAFLGMVTSLISLFLNCFGVVGMIAVMLSTIGIFQITENGMRGKKFAIAGILIGAISITYSFLSRLF